MLPLRSGDKLPQDPVFQHPPLWIHEAVAGKFVPIPKARPERKVPCYPGVMRKGERS